MNIRFIITTLLLLAFCLHSVMASTLAVSPSITNDKAENIRFSHLTIEDGLSSSVIQTICQDSLGFIWIGTEEGLNRYDGYEVIVYRHDLENQGSIRSDNITALLEESPEVLLIGTKHTGLCKFDRSRNTFESIPLYSGESIASGPVEIYDLHLDSSNQLWIASSEGLFLKKQDEDITCRIPFADEDPSKFEDIQCIYEDNNSRIWFGSRSYGLLSCNEKERNLARVQINDEVDTILKDASVLAIGQDKLGRKWIGLRNFGLIRINNTSNQTSILRQGSKVTGNDGAPGQRSMCFLLDCRGQFWIGTVGCGLVKYNYETDSFKSHINDDFDPYSLSDVSVYELFEDKSGQIWCATNNHVSYIPILQNVFELEYNRPGDNASIGSDSVYAIYKDQQEKLWLGLAQNGVSYLEPGDNNYHHIRPGDPCGMHSNYIRSVLVDSRDRLWLGSGMDGLYRLDPDAEKMVQYQSKDGYITSDFIRSLVEDYQGNIWFGGQNGLNCFEVANQQFVHYLNIKDNSNGLPGKNVYSILPLKEEIYWIGTNNGLTRFDRKNDEWSIYQHDEKNPTSLSNNTVYSLLLDTGGRLWVGTSHGLNIFNKAGDNFHRLTIKDGLPNNVIYAILEDSQGNIWCSTNMGLSSIKPDTLDIRNYDVSDGLQSNEFNGGAAFKDNEGYLYFGGIKGYNRFLPENLTKRVTEPTVSLVAIRLYGEPESFGIDIPLLNRLELEHNQNYLGFDFVALDQSARHKLNYQYKLEPFEKEWVNSGKRRTANYTNLPPGTYRFVARSTDRNGKWLNNDRTIEVVIQPAFWQTGWFRILSILGGSGIVFMLFRMRTQLLENQKKELEQTVTLKTRELLRKNDDLAAFSYSVSHDLRNPLWQINQYADILQGELSESFGTSAKAVELLQRISRISRDSTVLIDDLLQFSRFDKTELAISDINLTTIAMDTAAALREADPERNIRFEIEDNLQAFADMNLIKVLMKNLFSNAWKYTLEEDYPVIEFGQLQNSNEMPYYIKDNGIGFEMSKKDKLFTPFQRLHDSKKFSGSGIGLSLVQRIVRRHNGRIWAEAKPGLGATFYFTLPARAE